MEISEWTKFYLRPSENDLARYENEKHNLWLLHPIYQARKKLRFILIKKIDREMNSDQEAACMSKN